MRNQMSASTLVFLVFSCLVLSFVVAFIIREVYTLFHLKNLKGKVVCKHVCQDIVVVVRWLINTPLRNTRVSNPSDFFLDPFARTRKKSTATDISFLKFV
ncbi:hypothetical protein D3C80_1615660 [compost metagenome]